MDKIILKLHDLLTNNHILTIKDTQLIRALLYKYNTKCEPKLIGQLEQLYTHISNANIKEANVVLQDLTKKSVSLGYSDTPPAKDSESCIRLDNIIEYNNYEIEHNKYIDKVKEQFIARKNKSLTIDELGLRYMTIRKILISILRHSCNIIKYSHNNINQGYFNNLIAAYLKCLTQCDAVLDYIITPRPEDRPPPALVEEIGQQQQQQQQFFKKKKYNKVNFGDIRKDIDRDIRRKRF